MNLTSKLSEIIKYSISNKTVEEYHIMCPAGDDFAFSKAKQVFAAFDDLSEELRKMGDQKGYETEVIYGNLYDYFDKLKTLNLNFGLFKGDFMPYQEIWPGWSWNDYWTGYYSTRLHMKRLIREVFNKLQSTKTLLTIKAVQANKHSVQFDGDLENDIDEINKLIKEGEQRWAIMMHHDGITGTHTKVTENDYYNMLKESSDYFTKAYNKINQDFGDSADSKIVDKLVKTMGTLGNSHLDHYTIVNPSSNRRSEVINITLKYENADGDSYAVYIHSPDGSLTSKIVCFKCK